MELELLSAHKKEQRDMLTLDPHACAPLATPSPLLHQPVLSGAKAEEGGALPRFLHLLVAPTATLVTT